MAAAGDRPALIGNHVTIGHDELPRLAAECAAGLRRLGIGPGRVVALALGSSPDLVVGLLGVFAAGACAVPLNAQWWPRETTAVLDAVAPDLVLRSPAVNLGDHLPALAAAGRRRAADGTPLAEVARVVEVPPGTDAGSLLAPLRTEPAASTGPGVPLADLVADGAELWSPTTGCTGEPHTFGFDAEQLVGQWLAPLPEAPRSVACWTDAAHAPTLRLVLGALAGGAAVHLTERWAPRRALHALAERPVDLLWATAPQLARAARTAAPAGTGPDGRAAPPPTPPLAHRVVASGGPLHPPVAARLTARLGGSVSVRYTSTQAGGWVTSGHDHDAGPARALPGVATGPRATDVTATIEPAEGGPGEDGRGELHVAGPASARHAGGRDRQPRPARGWPTGDLAAIDGGGHVRLLGRLVDRYVSAGRLVVPIEVEVALGADPGVAEIAVVPRPDPDVGAIGVAVTVPADPEVPPFLSDLADRLAGLPPEARPTAQCVIGELPLSAGGHVHRRLLAFEEASR